MPGRREHDIDDFVAARTVDLHHDAYLLTASQVEAERLVTRVLAALDRERVDLAQAASVARLRMARAAAATELPGGDGADCPPRLRALARLTSRQRAILVLRVVDGHDRASAVRALQLSRREADAASAGIPPQLTDESDPAALRRLLEDFGDRAECPDPATTLAAARAVPPPSRRPRRRYAAAALVVALTASSVWLTQTWHDAWLRTAVGLNHTYGTDFPAYTQGYKLVDIRQVPPGPAQPLTLGTQDAVVIECADGETGATAVAHISSQLAGDFESTCSPGGHARQHLTPVKGETVVTIDDFRRRAWPVAVYRHQPWDRYPVARKDFTVEHDQTLASLRPTDSSGTPVRPASAGRVVTLRGTARHPDGTFTAVVPLPSDGPGQTTQVFSGLLSPTTTGQFRLLLGDQPVSTTCGATDQIGYPQEQTPSVCSLVDSGVPQVDFATTADPRDDAGEVSVQFTVAHALGPWTLQLVYDSYRVAPDGQFTTP